MNPVTRDINPRRSGHESFSKVRGMAAKIGGTREVDEPNPATRIFPLFTALRCAKIPAR
jgi:hypothetical protein